LRNTALDGFEALVAGFNVVQKDIEALIKSHSTPDVTVWRL